MSDPRIVIDTNVLVAGLRSIHGTSYQLLQLVDQGRFGLVLSVPLVLEYEATCMNMLKELKLNASDIEVVINYLCSVGEAVRISYLWRPFLPDPKDDMVLEAAIAGDCDTIVTFNKKDFVGTEQFGIFVKTPKEFLKRIGEIP